MWLISPNFMLSGSFFPNFGQGPFPQIAGKSPGKDNILTGGTAMGAASQLPGGCSFPGGQTHPGSWLLHP